MVWDYSVLLAKRLLIWALLSLGVGAWLLFQGTIPFNRGMGLQAVLWGTINAIIALLAWMRATRKTQQTLNWIEANRQSARLRRLLWINTGLDVLYICAGIWLWQIRGCEDPFIAGNGLGVTIQSAFLLVFDSLHALRVPHERPMPDLGIFDAPIHAPFFFEGSNGGAVLLVHGFPGSPAEVRHLGERLNQHGWSVQGICLPGHGHEFPRLFQVRVKDWIEAVGKALQTLKTQYSPVVLLGYSLGGGLSSIVAAQEPPHALVLLAPFWIREPILVRLATAIARLFLPVAFNPFRRMQINAPQARLAMGDLLPTLNIDAPEIQQAIREVRVPLIFLEQFRHLSRQVLKSAPRLTMPVLVIQAIEDQIVPRYQTRHLISRIPGKVYYIEVEGGHDINRRSHPGYTQMVAAVTQFVGNLFEQIKRA